MTKKIAILTITIIVFILGWYPSLMTAFALSTLIPNHDFSQDEDNNNLPDHWQHGQSDLPGISHSRFGWEQFPGSPFKAIWIIGGDDREGEWSCNISGLTANTDYILKFYAHRDTFINKVYPEVEIFNQSILLDNHCTYGGWQHFELHLNSRDSAPATTIKFKNRFPVKFWFAGPAIIPASQVTSLLSAENQGIMEKRMEFIEKQKKFFPLGIYGISNTPALLEIKRAGFNTAIIPPQPELVKTASDMDIKTIINISGGLADPNQVVSGITLLSSSSSLLSWYIADEPELSPFIPETFLPLLSILNKLDQVHPTSIAINRARLVPNYKAINNLFFMDEYPIPNMPLTWLSDSLDKAVATLGSHRVWSVIQAFGGQAYKDFGWPRFPDYHELRALTYLAIIHQVSGLLYFSYPDAFADQANWDNLTRIISELNLIYPWLTIPNLQENKKNELKLSLMGGYQTDALGKPAVHFTLKEKDDQFLLLTVNTLDHPVEISLDGLPQKYPLLKVLFENRKIVVKNGNLRDEFSAFETHLYSSNSNLGL